MACFWWVDGLFELRPWLESSRVSNSFLDRSMGCFLIGRCIASCWVDGGFLDWSMACFLMGQGFVS